MDPSPETRRLLISATLTAQARRHPGTSSGAGDLLALARELSEETGAIERAYRFRFDPPYPGVTAGPQNVGRTSRLLLACRVSDHDGTPIGVVFTALIADRPPQVSVAPAEASIPEDWRPPDDFR